MIYSETFKNDFELTRFCNHHKITKENIIQITHTECVYGYSGHDTYTLFYER